MREARVLIKHDIIIMLFVLLLLLLHSHSNVPIRK